MITNMNFKSFQSEKQLLEVYLNNSGSISLYIKDADNLEDYACHQFIELDKDDVLELIKELRSLSKHI